jgi:ATP-dependent Clp protease, protease subunit
MTNLQKLLASNRKVAGARGLRVVNAADGADATIYLYDFIVATQDEADWWGGVAADTFVKALNGMTAPTIHLRINSPGGDVFAGRAMETAVRQHSSKIVAHVDGYAASAATYVALAADEVEIAEGGMFMIHRAWSIAMGDADDLMNTAALLEKIDASIVATYAKETGLAVDKVVEMMAAETWMTGAEAVANGFADRIAEDAPPAENRVDWDLSALGKASAAKDAADAAARDRAQAEAQAKAAEQAAAEERARAYQDRARQQDHLHRIAA